MLYRYRGSRFYIVPGESQFQYLFGRQRVMDFLPKGDDKVFEEVRQAACSKKRIPDRVLLFDLEVLKRLFKLRRLLKNGGYDHTAIRLTDGFRPPRVNQPGKKVFGASKSQHLSGRAVDFSIGDVDRNGVIEECTDKRIVLEILSREVVPDGGLGLYPGDENRESMAAHIDVRGHCSRWFNHPARPFQARCSWYPKWMRPGDKTRARCVGK